MSTPDTVALLGEHRENPGPLEIWACNCGWTANPEHPDAFLLGGYVTLYCAHVAAVLDAHYADRERAAAEKALRDAADEWPGWWTFTRWLRDRADTYLRTDKEADRG